jgi:hypothetical protein
VTRAMTRPVLKEHFGLSARRAPFSPRSIGAPWTRNWPGTATGIPGPSSQPNVRMRVEGLGVVPGARPGVRGNAAFIRIYSARGLRQRVVHMYERCRGALEDLGVRATPSLDQLLAAATVEEAPQRHDDGPASPVLLGAGSVPPYREGRRTVTVLFAEVATTAKVKNADPEDVRAAVGGVLARVITEVKPRVTLRGRASYIPTVGPTAPPRPPADLIRRLGHGPTTFDN